MQLNLAGGVICALLLSGCASQPRELGREPSMSPVGSGLINDRPQQSQYVEGLRQGRTNTDDLSLHLFQDPRAHQVGDLVTVKIAINDSAAFDNKTNRARDAKTNYGLDAKLGGSDISREISGSLGLNSDTSTNGQGTIARSERIEFMVAALVTRVLPNGNLVIRGSQEVLVNHEIRELSIGGVIRSSDVNRDNTVTYDKIAEARVAYGGRGRLTEVQQPAYGQQLLDAFAPY